MQKKFGIQRGTYNYDDGGMNYCTLLVVDSPEEAAIHTERIQKRMNELAALYKEYTKYRSELEASMVSPLREDLNNELKALGDKPKFNHALAAVEGQKAAEKLHIPNLNAWHGNRSAVQEKFAPLIKSATDEYNRLVEEWLDGHALLAWERKHVTHYGYYTTGDQPLFTWRTVEVPYAVGDEDTLAILGG